MLATLVGLSMLLALVGGTAALVACLLAHRLRARQTRRHPQQAAVRERTRQARRLAAEWPLLAHTGTDYVADAWMASNGQANGSVRYDSDRAWFTIQGRPAALRELAEALVRCAELTEQTYPAPVAPVVEGVAG